jgi:uncharacterized membrane protein
MSVLSVVTESVKLIEQIIEWVHEGLSDEEIRKRLASPNGVAQNLIDAAKTRKQKLEDYVKNG